MKPWKRAWKKDLSEVFGKQYFPEVGEANVDIFKSEGHTQLSQSFMTEIWDTVFRCPNTPPKNWKIKNDCVRNSFSRVFLNLFIYLSLFIYVYLVYV